MEQPVVPVVCFWNSLRQRKADAATAEGCCVAARVIRAIRIWTRSCNLQANYRQNWGICGQVRIICWDLDTLREEKVMTWWICPLHGYAKTLPPVVQHRSSQTEDGRRVKDCAHGFYPRGFRIVGYFIYVSFTYGSYHSGFVKTGWREAFYAFQHVFWDSCDLREVSRPFIQYPWVR